MDWASRVHGKAAPHDVQLAGRRSTPRLPESIALATRHPSDLDCTRRRIDVFGRRHRRTIAEGQEELRHRQAAGGGKSAMHRPFIASAQPMLTTLLVNRGESVHQAVG